MGKGCGEMGTEGGALCQALHFTVRVGQPSEGVEQKVILSCDGQPLERPPAVLAPCIHTLGSLSHSARG